MKDLLYIQYLDFLG